MITGSEATFPTIGVPFIGPETFKLSQSTNSTYHFILRFSGGTSEGTNFIRGSITSSSFTTGGGGFVAWPELAEDALRKTPDPHVVAGEAPHLYRVRQPSPA